MAKISVLMPTYDQAQYLRTAIESVINQTFQDWELIIIDDGSNDNTKYVVDSFQDNRIKFFSNEKNLGLIATLNRGLSLASSELIARLDSDDCWINSQKLEKQFELMDTHADLGLVGTAAKIIDSERTIGYPEDDKKIRREMLIHNCFFHSSVLFRKQLALQAGGYDAKQKHIEDYDLWLKIGSKSKFANFSEPMLGYRFNPEGVTKKNNLEQIKSILKLIKDHRKAYPGYVFGWLKWRLQLLVYFLGLR